jgi:hypothetical protein
MRIRPLLTSPRSKLKGIVCPFCSNTRFRQTSIYRPLRSVKIVYCRCTKPECRARVKLKITLEYARLDDNSQTAC